jgi:hypothetical protein
MKHYVLLDENNIVIQTDVFPQKGFVEAPIGTDNGFQLQEDGSYKTPPKALDELKNNLFDRLMLLCDSKQNEAENFILKHKNTVGQRRRYQDKYERALAGGFSVGERAAIIQNHEAVRDAIRAFADLIEYNRSTVDDWITNNQLEKAEQAITDATSFGKDTTLDDVKVLLANAGAGQ